MYIWRSRRFVIYLLLDRASDCIRHGSKLLHCASIIASLVDKIGCRVPVGEEVGHTGKYH